MLIDDELNENTLRRWLRDQGIINTAAVADVIALRGKVGAFNLLNDKCRDRWASRLRDVGCDYLAFDCLRPSLTRSVWMKTVKWGSFPYHSTRYSPKPASTTP